MAWCGHGPSSVRLCAWLVVVRRHWLEAWAHLQLHAVPVLGCWTGSCNFFIGVQRGEKMPESYTSSTRFFLLYLPLFEIRANYLIR